MSGLRRILGLIRSINHSCEKRTFNLLPMCSLESWNPPSTLCTSFHSAAVPASQSGTDSQVDEINRLFADAREELEGAREVCSRSEGSELNL